MRLVRGTTEISETERSWRSSEECGEEIGAYARSGDRGEQIHVGGYGPSLPILKGACVKRGRGRFGIKTMPNGINLMPKPHPLADPSPVLLRELAL